MAWSDGRAERGRLSFHAFLTNGLSHIHHGLWRHPDSRQREYTDLSMWTDLARALERGRFDTIFFADTLGTFDEHQGGWKTSVKESLQIPSGDPLVLIPALAAATTDLGFVSTSSVLQGHPFPFARRMSTLDHLTKGRIGWNIVTSTRRHEARNLGLDDIPPHEERYARAEEYAEVVYALWEDSWENGAVIDDVESGRYVDPDRVHTIDHRGPRYQVLGPHMAEPSPQRTPVLFQAGSSEVGRSFAARHAEGTFIGAHDPTSAREVIDDIRRRAVAAGRRPDDILFIQGLTFVVGSSEQEARARSTEIDDWLSDDGMLAHMSGTIGIDLGSIDLDRPIADFESERVQGVVRSLAASAPDKAKTFRELARWAWSQRVVGTPEQVADDLERWAQAGVDGVNMIYVTLPGTYVDFIEHVGPVLQARGLMQHEYGPGTLRQKLFPGRPARLPERHPARHRRPHGPGSRSGPSGLPRLVDPATLAGALNDPSVVVVDATVHFEAPGDGQPLTAVGGASSYAGAHIPGAVFGDLVGDLSDPDASLSFTLPAPDRFEAAMDRLGIGADTHVVAYAQDSPMWATRLWWLLRYFGHESVSVLDGGLVAWRAAGLPVETGPGSPPERATTAFAAHPRPELLASVEAVEAVAAGAPACLINALPESMFLGQVPSAGDHVGRIPRSRNLPWSDLIDPATNRFRPPDEIRHRLARTGATDERAGTVIAYCGGGISATVDLFALAVVGRDDALLYDGSMAEWASDPGRPLVVGAQGPGGPAAGD